MEKSSPLVELNLHLMLIYSMEHYIILIFSLSSVFFLPLLVYMEKLFEYENFLACIFLTCYKIKFMVFMHILCIL